MRCAQRVATGSREGALRDCCARTVNRTDGKPCLSSTPLSWLMLSSSLAPQARLRASRSAACPNCKCRASLLRKLSQPFEGCCGEASSARLALAPHSSESAWPGPCNTHSSRSRIGSGSCGTTSACTTPGTSRSPNGSPPSWSPVTPASSERWGLDARSVSSPETRRQGSLTESGDGDVLVEVHVLDGVQQLNALFHGALERLASADQPGAAGPLVDH